MKLFRSTFLVSSLTLISRILGLLRETLMASLFGASKILDAFILAFTLPNLSRRLFGEGALSSAVIPVFSDHNENKGQQKAYSFANKILSLMLAFGLVLIVVAITAALVVFFLVTDPEEKLVTVLAAIMMPYLLLICLTAVMGAILNVLGNFLYPALAPIVLNVSWILTLIIILYFDHNGNPIHWTYYLAIMVLIAGVLQLSVQVLALRQFGFSFRYDFDSSDDGVREVQQKFFPILFGSAVLQLNVVFDRLIAWWLVPNEGALTVLYMGNRLMQFPLAIIGISLATVVFPLFTKQAVQKRFDLLAASVPQAFRVSLFLALPSAVGLMVLASPLITLIYQYNQFDQEDAFRTAFILFAYGSGLWLSILQQIINRVFYSLGDTQTPMKIAMVCVLLNVVLNLLLVLLMGEVGLALSTSVCAFVNFYLSVVYLAKQFTWSDQGMKIFVVKIGLASIVMAFLVLLCDHSLVTYLTITDNFWERVTRVFIPTVVGVISYFCITYLMKVEEIFSIIQKIKRS